MLFYNFEGLARPLPLCCQWEGSTVPARESIRTYNGERVCQTGESRSCSALSGRGPWQLRQK